MPEFAMFPAVLPARIGIIGDVHAEHERLEAALDHLAAHEVGAVLCVGDLADGSGSLPRCVELLHERRVMTVRGNHDRWLLSGTMRDFPEATELNGLPERTRAYLADLPVTREFTTALGGLVLCHGLGPNDMAKLGPDDYGYAVDVNDDLQALMRDPRYQFVVNGHSHRAMVRGFPGLTVINAGTLRGAEEAGFLLVDFHVRRVELLRFAESAIAVHRVEALG